MDFGQKSMSNNSIELKRKKYLNLSSQIAQLDNTQDPKLPLNELQLLLKETGFLPIQDTGV